MVSYHFKLAFAVLFLVLADVAFCADNPVWVKPPLTCYKCDDVTSCENPKTEEICTTTTEQCVTEFGADGKVKERGCRTTCESDSCFLCKSHKCNIATKREDYISCLDCNSDGNDKCDTAPETKTKQCHKGCMVASYKKKDSDPSYEYVRSCLDDKSSDDQKKCGTEDLSCKKCNAKDCNNDKWLKCYQCDEKDCDESKVGTKSACPNYKKEDTCVFIFGDDKKLSKAMCKSSLKSADEESLRKAGKLYECKPDEACNEVPKIPQCVVCDSKDDPKCVREPSALTPEDCDFNHCFSRIEGEDTKRGCFTNLKDGCTDDANSPCEQCTTDKCNKNVYPNNRKQCYHCDGKDCDESKVGTKSACLNYKKEDTCVFIFGDDKKLSKAMCKSSLKSADEESLRKAGKLYECKPDEACNEVPKIPQCVVCDSKDDPKCAREPSALTPEDCDFNHCFSRIEGEDTKRGCFTNLKDGCTDDPNSPCEQCTTDKCNKNVYPNNRKQCYHCDGKDCDESKVGTKSACLNYKKEDTCVFIFGDDKKLSKAMCKSSLKSADEESLRKAGKLYECKPDEACNEVPKIPRCVVCDSKDEPKCVAESSSLTPKDCDFNHCFSRIEGEDTKRGCFTSLKGGCTDDSSSLCTQCKEDNCNNKIYPEKRRKCHICTSETYSECEAKPNKLETCPKFDADDSCVTEYIKEKKVTKRGCKSGMPCDEKDSKKCQVCKEDGCNTIDLKKVNGAMGIYLTVGAVLAMLCHLVL